MPGPNGEQCKKCQCYKKNASRINEGHCKAHGPKPFIVDVILGRQRTIIVPPVSEDDYCIHDFKKAEDES